MKKTFKIEMVKVLSSQSIYISIILNLIVLSAAFWTRNITVAGGMKEYGICHEFFFVFYFTTTPELIILISSFPFVGSFCNEWNSGYAKFAASRTGIGRYLRSKVLLCIVGTVFTAFVSQMLMAIILMTKIPIMADMGRTNLEVIYPFCSLVGSPYLYLVVRLLCYSTFCGIWCCVGLLVSAFIPNKYVVYAAPYIGFYLIEQIFNNKIAESIPSFMSLMYLATTSLVTKLFGNVVLDFLYINFLFIIIAGVLGCCFVKYAGRRMRYE